VKKSVLPPMADGEAEKKVWLPLFFPISYDEWRTS